MSESEIELFTSFLDATDSYFEFGMGGSTVLASKHVEGRIYAIDSDPAWVSSVRDHIGADRERCDLVHVDIGPTRQWGWPADESNLDRFRNYSRSIALAPHAFGLCLVDGRFRVACFLQALLNMPKDGVVAIHDYGVRKEYHVVETFARTIAKKDNLFFFNRRPSVSAEDIGKAYEDHFLDPQ